MSKVFRTVACVVLVCVSSFALAAQDGAGNAYSPYSVFGVGDIIKQGTSFNKSMGGVGIATRNNRFINYLNPAAVTARDTLAFMMDFGLSNENKIYKQNGIKSANNTFNIYDFVLTMPIYRKSAFILGITPYSSVGYDFSYDVTDPNLVAQAGNIKYGSTGTGGMYQVFGGVGATFWKRLSVGAQFLYYFGNISKATTMDYEKSSFRDISSGYKLQLHSFSGKFGLQYDQPINNGYYMTFGATYKLGSKLRGNITDYSYTYVSSISDTLRYNVDTLGSGSKVKLADEIGVGISFRKGDKWMVEFNYLRSNWNKSGFDSYTGFSNIGKSTFSSSVSESYRAGFEYTPNRNDVRYYMRRCSYRGGIYYDKDYYQLDNNTIKSYGVTLGMTFPVFRWYNGLSVAVDMGQRGSISNNMLRERYVMFVVGFNIHDIWFQKPKYE